jgi:hypothetical protein
MLLTRNLCRVRYTNILHYYYLQEDAILCFVKRSPTLGRVALKSTIPCMVSIDTCL